MARESMSKVWRRAALNLVLGGALAPTFGCATLGDKTAELFGDVADATDLPLVSASTRAGQSAYASKGKSPPVEWWVCQPSDRPPAGAGSSPGAPWPAVIVLHGHHEAFAAKTVCGGAIVQAFLAQGYAVLAINRPGYGRSAGQRDSGGSESQAALLAAATGARAASGPQATPAIRVVGAFGYGTTVAIAGQLARQLKDISFLVLGGGVYDYEQVLTKTADPALRQELQALKGVVGDKGLEDRSLAYDISGLPARVLIYHGRLDQAAPLEQAQAFADSLAAAGRFRGDFHPLSGEGHEFPPPRHRHIIEALLRDLNASSKS